MRTVSCACLGSGKGRRGVTFNGRAGRCDAVSVGRNQTVDVRANDMPRDAGRSLECEHTLGRHALPRIERLVLDTERLGKLAQATRSISTLFDEVDHD